MDLVEYARRQKLAQEMTHQAPPEDPWTKYGPGLLDFATSLIPVYGSGRDAVNDFKEGNYGSGIFNTAMAGLDAASLGGSVAAKAAGMKALPALFGMIKSSHGSPHLFNKFDFTKIGTGEGAQAYGHGGYFAQGFDSPVANMYADALGSRNQDLVNSAIDRVVQIHGGDAAKIKSELLSAGLPSERITPELETSIARIVRGTDPLDGSVSSSALKEYESLQNLVPNEKHLYNVELKWPDAAREAADPLGEHHLLDWFEPLSKQSEHVKKALRDYATLSGKEHYLSPESNLPVYTGEGISPDTRAKEYYEWLASQPLDTRGLASRELASSALKAFDVPGIKYWDEGSRSARQGTRNYVMFDDRIPQIITRNGKPISGLLDYAIKSR